ncbi:MAG: RluA family pseudouridine synthase [Candidatus Omnitrophota bacterium]
MNIPIVFEDDWLLVADKPAGLLSVPSSGGKSRNLTDILNQDAAERNLTYRFYPCHRLDRDTSGLIVYAKSRQIEKKMADAFRARQVEKKYIAFVHGKLPVPQGRISSPIEGKSALTMYRKTGERNAYSIVEVSPLTGRTNQIRIHFKRLCHPLVGEDRFAFRKDFPLRAKRVCLHAGYLSFKHPETGKMLVWESPLPEDMKKFLATH